MIFRTRYNLGEPTQGLSCVLPSKTQQQFKDECDLEQLLKRHNIYDLIGLSNTDSREPLYADVSEIPDFHEAQTHLASATQYFEGLPSDIRAKFENSVSNFLETLNTADVSKLQELGILKKEEAKVEEGTQPSVTEPVNPVKEPVKASDTTSTEVKTS